MCGAKYYTKIIPSAYKEKNHSCGEFATERSYDISKTFEFLKRRRKQ